MIRRGQSNPMSKPDPTSQGSIKDDQKADDSASIGTKRKRVYATVICPSCNKELSDSAMTAIHMKRHKDITRYELPQNYHFCALMSSQQCVQLFRSTHPHPMGCPICLNLEQLIEDDAAVNDPAMDEQPNKGKVFCPICQQELFDSAAAAGGHMAKHPDIKNYQLPKHYFFCAFGCRGCKMICRSVTKQNYVCSECLKVYNNFTESPMNKSEIPEKKKKEFLKKE